MDREEGVGADQHHDDDDDDDDDGGGDTRRTSSQPTPVLCIIVWLRWGLCLPPRLSLRESVAYWGRWRVIQEVSKIDRYLG
jgi:hypothetical protein